MQSSTFGKLNAIVTVTAGQGSGTSANAGAEPEQTVVLLHGFGAPGTDLVGLAQELRPAKTTRFVFLQAPHTLPGMSGPYAGRAWWHIDMIELQVMRMTGQFDVLAQQVPEGLAEARAMLDEALQAIVQLPGASADKLYVGGFSQGSMLSCDWALRSDWNIAGLIVLSGTTLCEPVWRERAQAHAGLRVFQSHSPDDEVLPLALAERLRGILSEAGMPHTWVTFRGGHGIGPSVIDKLRGFLA